MSFLADQMNPPESKPDPASLGNSAAPATTPRYQWVVIEADLFPGEEVLCVIDQNSLDEARAENPGLVTYTMAEIDLLYPIRHQRERIQSLHRVKKKFGGWIREITGGDDEANA